MKLKAIDAILVSVFVLSIVLIALVYLAINGPVAEVRSMTIHEIPGEQPPTHTDPGLSERI